LSVVADCTNLSEVKDAFIQIRKELGHPEVLIHCVSAGKKAGILELTAADVEGVWKALCLSAFLTAQEVLPEMTARGRGSILFTGATASLRGNSTFAPLAIGKVGLRALAQSMAKEFAPKGIHVGHVIVDGPIKSEKSSTYKIPEENLILPESIAETFWNLHKQDKSCWTFEMGISGRGSFQLMLRLVSYQAPTLNTVL